MFSPLATFLVILITMDSIQHMLAGRLPEVPPEIALIKRYADSEFGMAVEVIVRDKHIQISAPDAGLINTLRLRTPEIQAMCSTDKRLTFRVS